MLIWNSQGWRPRRGQDRRRPFDWRGRHRPAAADDGRPSAACEHGTMNRPTAGWGDRRTPRITGSRRLRPVRHRRCPIECPGCAWSASHHGPWTIKSICHYKVHDGPVDTVDWEWSLKVPCSSNLKSRLKYKLGVMGTFRQIVKHHRIFAITFYWFKVRG